jgi:two-component system, cell cycle sensor histidine kinase and response regulator CckA
MTFHPESPALKIRTTFTRLVWGLAIAWTVIIVALLLLNVWHHKQLVEQTALAQARTHFQKDLAFRAWATSHGGVYVPVTEETPANPHLSHIFEQDIETPSGRKLTLMNPAYMMRQLFAKSGESYGVHEHITSLQPLSPANAPDTWEKEALTAFSQGKNEAFEFSDFNGAPHLRLMQPLITTEGCLKCHADHGYKLGDVRGGISIALPVDVMLAHERRFSLIISLTLGLVWVLGIGSLLLGRHHLMRRISERNQAMNALEQSQARYSEAQRIARLGHWELDFATKRLDWSDEVYRIFEIDPQKQSASYELLLNSTHPEDRLFMEQAYSQSVQDGNPYDITHRLLMKDGSIKYLWERCETYYDESGQPLRSLGTVMDITERRRAEEALSESEERLNMALTGAELGMWDWSVPTGAIVINDRWAEMLGYHREDVEPHLSSWEKLVHPDDAALVLASLTDYLEGGASFYQAEYRMLAKSGEWKWIYDTGKIMSRDKSGRPLRAVGIHLDITQRKYLLELAVQQERLAAVGQLSAGIAHDFNNTLTSILGFTELLYDSCEIPESARKYLEIIISSGQRAATLIRQMLDFSRKSIRSPKLLDLALLLKEVVKFLQRAIPETITVRLEIAPGDYLVQADPAQIQQIVTNLALNARDAMPSGGDLLVVLSRVELTGEERCATCDQPIVGGWASLTITDTGSGISPTILPKIFEPFFTTKEVGKGSGLGLSQVHGIVKQHDGHLNVQSQPGQGTTFTIYFPLLLSGKEPVETGEVTAVPRGQGETILVVEDELTVLAVINKMLRELGYQVLAASDGYAALKIFAEHHQNIALVLSDMVMPHMDGAALYAALKTQCPEVKVILMSAYSLQDRGIQLLEDGDVDWLQKPPSLQALSRIIDKALNRS